MAFDNTGSLWCTTPQLVAGYQAETTTVGRVTDRFTAFAIEPFTE